MGRVWTRVWTGKDRVWTRVWTGKDRVQTEETREKVSIGVRVLTKAPYSVLNKKELLDCACVLGAGMLKNKEEGSAGVRGQLLWPPYKE